MGLMTPQLDATRPGSGMPSLMGKQGSGKAGGSFAELLLLGAEVSPAQAKTLSVATPNRTIPGPAPVLSPKKKIPQPREIIPATQEAPVEIDAAFTKPALPASFPSRPTDDRPGVRVSSATNSAAADLSPQAPTALSSAASHVLEAEITPAAPTAPAPATSGRAQVPKPAEMRNPAGLPNPATDTGGGQPPALPASASSTLSSPPKASVVILAGASELPSPRRPIISSPDSSQRPAIAHAQHSPKQPPAPSTSESSKHVPAPQKISPVYSGDVQKIAPARPLASSKITGNEVEPVEPHARTVTVTPGDVLEAKMDDRPPETINLIAPNVVAPERLSLSKVASTTLTGTDVHAAVSVPRSRLNTDSSETHRVSEEFRAALPDDTRGRTTASTLSPWTDTSDKERVRTPDLVVPSPQPAAPGTTLVLPQLRTLVETAAPASSLPASHSLQIVPAAKPLHQAASSPVHEAANPGAHANSRPSPDETSPQGLPRGSFQTAPANNHGRQAAPTAEVVKADHPPDLQSVSESRPPDTSPAQAPARHESAAATAAPSLHTESKTLVPVSPVVASHTQSAAPASIPVTTAQPTASGAPGNSPGVTLPGSAKQPATSAAPAPPSPPAGGEVQQARMVDRSGQAEMHIDLRSPAFGSVEVHTVVRQSQVGLTVGSEKGDLRWFLSPEIPALQSNLGQHQLQFEHIRFLTQAAQAGTGFSAFADAHSQSGPQGQPGPVTRRSSEPGSGETAEIENSEQSGLNVHA